MGGPGSSGVRLCTVEVVFAYAQAEGVELRLDANEVQVRGPRVGRGGKQAFVSGKKGQSGVVPHVDSLAADTERAGDLGLGVLTGLEQGSGEHAVIVELFRRTGARGGHHAL